MICGQVEEVDPPREQEDPGIIYYEKVAYDPKHRENSLGVVEHGNQKARNLLRGATSLFPS